MANYKITTSPLTIAQNLDLHISYQSGYLHEYEDYYEAYGGDDHRSRIAAHGMIKDMDTLEVAVEDALAYMQLAELYVLRKQLNKTYIEFLREPGSKTYGPLEDRIRLVINVLLDIGTRK